MIAMLALGLLGVLAGCESATNKEMKRAQDRAAIQLSQAQRDRDEYKAQVAKLQSALAEAQAKQTLAQQQVAALRSDLQKALDASVEAQKAHTDSQKATAQTQQAVQDLARQVQTSQAEALRLAEENKALKGKLADARAASAVQASSPTTMPNK